MSIIPITDFDDPQLDIYARRSEGQLLHFYEPKEGIFIAESPRVIQTAFDEGYEPISFLVEERHVKTQAKHILEQYPDIPAYTASYDVLKKYDYSDNIMEVVLSHHECYDGSGYPDGLVGEDIPIGARILKVTDEFAALISDRPYRKAFDIDTAVSIMIDEVKNLDMKVFILFQRLIHEESTLELIKNSRIDIDDLDISDILDI